MLEASLAALIKTVLIILLVYFGFKILFRWFGPMILRYFLKKVGRQFQQQFGQKAGEKEGEVTIDKKSSQNHRSNKKVGEYIDYEEID